MCALGDEVCGRHSGIPPCCVAWYIRVWNPLFVWSGPGFAPIYTWLNSRGLWSTASTRHVISDVSYIQHIRCPGCRQCGAYVHVRACPPIAESP